MEREAELLLRFFVAMLLTIDVGNTNTTFALFDGDSLAADWRVSTVHHRTADEYAAIMRVLMEEERLRFDQVSEVAISCVVPPALESLLRFASKHLRVNHPTVLSPEIDLGIKVRYVPVTDVGADRLANAIAAHAKYSGKVIVVDFGTATTLDAVSADGEYLGGAIMPGIQISMDALFRHASRLMGVSLTTPSAAIGTTTTGSLQSGLVFGFAGQVDALVDRFQDEMGGGAKVVATGGLADVIARESRTIELCDPLLTLEGLKMVHRIATEQRK